MFIVILRETDDGYGKVIRVGKGRSLFTLFIAGMANLVGSSLYWKIAILTLKMYLCIGLADVMPTSNACPSWEEGMWVREEEGPAPSVPYGVHWQFHIANHLTGCSSPSYDSTEHMS